MDYPETDTDMQASWCHKHPEMVMRVSEQILIKYWTLCISVLSEDTHDFIKYNGKKTPKHETESTFCESVSRVSRRQH